MQGALELLNPIIQFTTMLTHSRNREEVHSLHLHCNLILFYMKKEVILVEIMYVKKSLNSLMC